jgi:hypothetical protein
MRRARLALFLISLTVIAPVLAGCEDFDPDKLDIFNLNEKKKIPGERKEVFPQGVPGVSQGIPPDLIKGNQPPPEAAQAEPSAAQKAAEAEPPKPKPKKKPKPRVAAKPTPQQASPQPAAAQDPGQQQQQPTAQSSPWPAAPAPGTFQR